MGSSSLMFNLMGRDVSATSALDTIQSKGKSVAGALGAAFAAVKLGDVFSNAINKEKALDDFTAAVNATPEAAARAGQVAGKLFKSGITDNMADIRGAMVQVGQQFDSLDNISSPTLEALVRGGLTLKGLYGTDLASSIGAAGAMMRNGLATDGVQAMDLVTAGLKGGLDRGGDFLQVMNEYGPAFKQLGIDGPTALGMINTAMAEGAPSATAAAEGVRSFANLTQQDGKKVSEVLQSLGMNGDEMVRKIAAGGPEAKDAFTQIVQAVNTVQDPATRAQDSAALFGRAWKKSGDDILLSLDPTKAMMLETADASDKMATTAEDNAATKIQATRNQFGMWLKSLTAIPGGLGEVATTMIAVGPDVLQMAGALGAIVMALQNIGVFSKIAAAGQWLLNAAMSANPVMIIVLAIAALVAGFIYLWNTSEGFRQFWIDLWETCKNALGAAVDWIKQRWNDIVTWFGQTFDTVKEWFVGRWNDVKSFFGGIVDWFRQRVSDVRDFFVNTWTNLRDRVVGLFTDAKNWIGSRISDIKQFATDVKQWFTDRFQDIYNFVAGIFNGISSTITGIGTGIYGFVSGIFNWVKQRIDDVINFIQSIPSRISGAIGSISATLDQAQSSNSFIGAVRKGLSYVTPYPFLASGGVVMPTPGGTTVTVAEAGEPEVVAPLSKWASLTGGSGGGAVNVTVNGFVGSEYQLAKAIQDAVGKARRAGMIPPGGF